MSRKDVFVGSSLWIPIQERLIGRVSPLKFPSRNSFDLYVFRVFPPHQNIFSEDVFVGSCLWIPIQERLIRRVSPLKIPSRNSSDLHVFRVFPLAKTSFCTCFSWIMLVDPDSETTYRTSFPAKNP
jgi:hypothetical protein